MGTDTFFTVNNHIIFTILNMEKRHKFVEVIKISKISKIGRNFKKIWNEKIPGKNSNGKYWYSKFYASYTV